MTRPQLLPQPSKQSRAARPPVASSGCGALADRRRPPLLWTFELWQDCFEHPGGGCAARVCCLEQRGVCSGHGAAPAPAHAKWVQAVISTVTVPSFTVELLLLITSLSRIRHFSSTFAPLPCCGLSAQVTRGAGWEALREHTPGFALRTAVGVSQVGVFLVASSGRGVCLRPDACGGERLVPEERQVVSGECHTQATGLAGSALPRPGGHSCPSPWPRPQGPFHMGASVPPSPGGSRSGLSV